MQNPHDSDAHYADKGTKQWIGYKVHVMESVDPEEDEVLDDRCHVLGGASLGRRHRGDRVEDQHGQGLLAATAFGNAELHP